MKSSFKTFIKNIFDSLIGFCLRHKFGIRWLRYLPKGYNHVLDIMVSENPCKDYTVFDVGANIGQSVYFYKRNLCSPMIYSFEPVSSTFQQLEKNTATCKNVKVYNLAMGSEKKTTRIQLSHQILNNSLKQQVYKNHSTNNYEEVKIIRLDDFCLENSVSVIHILKIDTEGFDLDVLMGGQEMLKKGLIQFIYIEVGFNNEPDKVRLHKINDFLSKYNYKFSGLYEVNRTGYNDLPVLYANALFSL